MSNLELWNRVCETDPGTTRTVNDGRHTFTAIDAYGQIKAATAIWGAYGRTWGLKAIDISPIGEGPLAMLSGVFFFPDQGEFPIHTSIKMFSNTGKWDDDFCKKLETDAITKALSRLGFNADVFLGKYDDNKYVQGLQEKYTPVPDVLVKKFGSLIDSNNVIRLWAWQKADKPLFLKAYNSYVAGIPTGKVSTRKKIDQMIKDGFNLVENTAVEIATAMDSNEFNLAVYTESLTPQELHIVESALKPEHKTILEQHKAAFNPRKEAKEHDAK